MPSITFICEDDQGNVVKKEGSGGCFCFLGKCPGYVRDVHKKIIHQGLKAQSFVYHLPKIGKSHLPILEFAFKTFDYLGRNSISTPESIIKDKGYKVNVKGVPFLEVQHCLWMIRACTVHEGVSGTFNELTQEGADARAAFLFSFTKLRIIQNLSSRNYSHITIFLEHSGGDENMFLYGHMSLDKVKKILEGRYSRNFKKEDPLDWEEMLRKNRPYLKKVSEYGTDPRVKSGAFSIILRKIHGKSHKVLKYDTSPRKSTFGLSIGFQNLPTSESFLEYKLLFCKELQKRLKLSEDSK